MGAADSRLGAQSKSKQKLLIVDDDESHCLVLKLAFEKRGYAVSVANCARDAVLLAENWKPNAAVVDLRMPGPSGLTLIPRLRWASEGIRIVVLTGYGSIATAIEAIKLGAVYYLTKPVDAAAIEAALYRDSGNESVPLPPEQLTVNRVAWEHIQHVLAEHHGNVSAAARALGMHRRTLQRKLCKLPARV